MSTRRISGVQRISGETTRRTFKTLSPKTRPSSVGTFVGNSGFPNLKPADVWQENLKYSPLHLLLTEALYLDLLLLL